LLIVPEQSIEKLVLAVRRIFSAFRAKKEKNDIDVSPKLLILKIIELLKTGLTAKQAVAIVLNRKDLVSNWSLDTLHDALVEYYITEDAGKSIGAMQKTKAKEVYEYTYEMAKSIFAAINFSEEIGCQMISLLSSISKTIDIDLSAKQGRKIAISASLQTVKLLKVLPLFGVALGFLLNVNTVKILLDGKGGFFCLCIGVIFFYAGTKWTNKLLGKANKE
jgi:hypothetical protein